MTAALIALTYVVQAGGVVVLLAGLVYLATMGGRA